MEIYTKFNSILTKKEDIFLEISLLPKYLQVKILKYKAAEKRQQRIEGLKLLQKAFISDKLNESEFNLHCIKYNSFGKPYINNKIDFSLSYCRNNIVLAFIENGIIGIDIEELADVNFENFKFLFTENEWKLIEIAPSPNFAFFKLWTRKEAVSKALGKGAFLDYNSFEVIEDKIEIENQLIYISSNFIDNNYWVSIANNKELFRF